MHMPPPALHAGWLLPPIIHPAPCAPNGVVDRSRGYLQYDVSVVVGFKSAALIKTPCIL